MTEAKFYKKLTDNSIQCGLCNHFCTIKDGEAGICGTRQNKQGSLYSLVYGRPAAQNADPVEKKPFYHFMPGTLSYSFGTLGCNFRCANCQNFDISQPGDIEKQAEKITEAPPAKIVEEALSSNCRSISYTYNEPTVFAEYALDIMKLARQAGLKNIWVSNGYMSRECLDAVIPYLDAANIDLKSCEDQFYRENCGARLRPVLDNLRILKNSAAHLEITTLVIPNLSDDVEMLKQLATHIVQELGADTPWHISKFSGAISWRLANLPATPDETLYAVHTIGKEAGLKYVYVGNIPGDERENTYCPHCGEIAIRRFGYDVERFDRQGHCPQCDYNLDIIE